MADFPAIQTVTKKLRICDRTDYEPRRTGRIDGPVNVSRQRCVESAAIDDWSKRVCEPAWEAPERLEEAA